LELVDPFSTGNTSAMTPQIVMVLLEFKGSYYTLQPTSH
jgi:hypothetical protein